MVVTAAITVVPAATIVVTAAVTVVATVVMAVKTAETAEARRETIATIESGPTTATARAATTAPIATALVRVIAVVRSQLQKTESRGKSRHRKLSLRTFIYDRKKQHTSGFT